MGRASRSIDITLIDKSGSSFRFTGDNLQHGVRSWLRDDSYGMESNGMMTGCEGDVTLTNNQGKQVVLHASNPYYGTLSSNIVNTGGYPVVITGLSSGGGDNANGIVTIGN